MGLFCRNFNIWPKIKKEFPNLKLLIGGGICKRPEIQNKGEDIELLGKINDLQNFYSKGDIFINPVFEGTGLKIKNIEALSYGKIVICHPHNIEGIFQQNKAPILIAKDSEEYATQFRKIFGSTKTISELKNKVEFYIKDYNKIVQSRFEEALR